VTLTSAMVKEAAFAAGAGDVGIANIERFAGAPRMMHPLNIAPDCRSVITIVQPIPRGTYRGITEGTHWTNYTIYSYNRLNTLYRPLVTYETACFIEDHGHEAVPLYPGVPERPGTRPPVAEGRPAPDINIQVRVAAVACGVGEIGWSKVLLTRKFGPRVRLGTILTDAELEPDPLPEPSLCNRCMRCVRDCPGGAIPMPGDRPTIKVQIEDRTYEWADTHMGRCTLTHHGMNWEASPFLKHDFPGFDLDVRGSTLSEEAAYKLTYPLAQARWLPSPEFPNVAVLPFYHQAMAHTGYFAVCGAKGCIRACMDSLEQRGCIEQNEFATPVWARPDWKLPRPETDETGGIAEGKFADFRDPDPDPGGWE